MATDFQNTSIKDVQTQILVKQIESVKEMFHELDKKDVRVIPENMFVHHFLPFFSGEVTENSSETVANWLTIAGSAVHPVNIINNTGQVVAQVPPIQNNSALDPSAKSETNLAYTLKESKALSSLSPTAGQSVLMGELNNKLMAMTEQQLQKNKEHEDKWNKLLSHYGKKPLNYTQDQQTQEGEGDVFGF